MRLVGFLLMLRDSIFYFHRHKFISVVDCIASNFYLPEGNLITINVSYKVHYVQTYTTTNYIECEMDDKLFVMLMLEHNEIVIKSSVFQTGIVYKMHHGPN